MRSKELRERIGPFPMDMMVVSTEQRQKYYNNWVALFLGVNLWSGDTKNQRLAHYFACN